MTSAEHTGAERYQPRPYQRKLGVLVVAATLLSGCGSGLGGDQVVTTVLAEVPADPSVQPMLADGEVTTAEMNRAFQAYIQCMADAGMIGSYAYDAERIGHNWAMEYATPGDDPEGRRTDAISNRCYGRFVTPLESEFEDELSPAEQADRLRQSILDCLTEVDPSFATIPPDLPIDSASDFQDQLYRSGNEAAAECIDTAGLGWTDFSTGGLP